jgi:hypothetical protein
MIVPGSVAAGAVTLASETATQQLSRSWQSVFAVLYEVVPHPSVDRVVIFRRRKEKNPRCCLKLPSTLYRAGAGRTESTQAGDPSCDFASALAVASDWRNNVRQLLPEIG